MLADSAHRMWLAGALLCTALLAAIAFAPAVQNEFVYDDHPIIVDNRLVTQPQPWYRFWREPYWPRGVGTDKLYRPLTIWSFRANTVLAGTAAPNPIAFHIVNVALHIAASIGVALLAYRLCHRSAAAWIAGALFATHPLHTEAVVTGYGRSELLAGLFGVWLLVRHIKPANEQRAQSIKFHVISSLLFLLAVMSKEHAVFLWPAILLIDLWPRNEPRQAGMSRREWLNRVLMPSHVGFVIATAIFFFLRFSVFGQYYRLDPSLVRRWESPLGHAGLMEHLLTPFRLLWLTLELCVWPPWLCPVWGLNTLLPAGKISADVAAGMTVAAALLILMWLFWRRRSMIGAMIGSMILFLLIPIQALPMAHWFYAERWLYLPSVAIAVLAGAMVSRLRFAGVVMGLSVAIILLPHTWSYGGAFASDGAMTYEILRKQPDNFKGRMGLANLMMVHRDYHAAVQAANDVIERFEPVADPYKVLIYAYLELGDGRRALDAIETYERLRADIPEPSLIAPRERARALMAARSQPATASSPAPR